MKKWLAAGCLLVLGACLILASGLAWLFWTEAGRLMRAEVACRSGRGAECRYAATAHRARGSEARALASTLRACTLGDNPACDETATAAVFGDGLRIAPETSQSFMEQACESGALRRRLSIPVGILACRRLGEALASGQGLMKDATKSAVMFDRACGDGDALSCKALAALRAAESPAADPEARRTVDERTCHFGRADVSERPLLLRVDSSGWTLNNEHSTEEQTAARLSDIFMVRENKTVHLFWAGDTAPDGSRGPERIASAVAVLGIVGGTPILLLGDYDKYVAAVTASCNAIGEASPFAPM